MKQDRIRINNKDIKQPDSGQLGWDFSTTSTQDSVRVQTGRLHNTSLFTVESNSYSASNLTIAEMRAILQEIIGKNFTLHYFSPYYGIWRDDEFYVAKGSLKVGSLKAGEEKYDSLSFNAVGVNPI